MRTGRNRRRCVSALGVVVVVLFSASARAVVFEVTYADAQGEGFYDQALGQARRTAFARAADCWSKHLSDAGTVRIETRFDNLGGSGTSATLGYAGPTLLHANFSGAPAGDVWYPAALADTIAGRDLAPGGADIIVVFNADVDGSVLGTMDWHYGEDVSTPADIDFQTVTMHELAHGLGFFSSFNSDGTWGFNGRPVVYDTGLVNSAGQRLIDLPADAGNVTGAVFFDGASAAAAYAETGGTGAVPVFAPSEWRGGSSISHWDEATFQGEEVLMTPYYDGGLRQIDPITLGLMDDLGWAIAVPANDGATAVPEPAAAVLLMTGALALASRRRRSLAVR